MLANDVNASSMNLKCFVVALAFAMVTAGSGCGEDNSDDLAERERRADAAEQRALEQEERLDQLEREAAEERAQDAQSSRTSPSATPEAEAPGELLTAADQRSFEALAARLGGSSGLAVSGLGRGQRPDVVGTLRSGPAWSTIKVPIAIAAQSRGTGSAAAARAAITASDNAAAEKLWAALGGGSTAGAAVERVLADAGDAATRVQTQRVRPEFTAFGQTEWPLAAQQRFMAGVSCLNAVSADVLDLMQQTVASQRWGIGAVGLAAQMKGGWGPDESGDYLVRQMGAVVLRNGKPMALSIVTKPADGTFETGKRNVTAIARWAISHVTAGKLPREPRC
jgi:hypothetical protein